MQDTDNLNDNLIHNIDEDIKMNGFKKWLCYLKWYVKHRDEMDKEDLEDTREHIIYNYKKEEHLIDAPQ